MEEGGFEPPKAKPADLQSVPFGHLGTPPYELDGVPAKPSAAGFVGKGDAVKRPGFRRSRKQGMCNLHRRGGAGGRIRTPDLLITNQLLYQLSYTSTQRHFLTAKVIITGRKELVNTFGENVLGIFWGAEAPAQRAAGLLRPVPGGTAPRRARLLTGGQAGVRDLPGAIRTAIFCPPAPAPWAPGREDQ